MFFQGDKVVYHGARFSELRHKIGEVWARVQNSSRTVVVDFGDDSYVLNIKLLSKYKPSKESNSKEPEVQIRRRRHLDDDE